MSWRVWSLLGGLRFGPPVVLSEVNGAMLASVVGLAIMWVVFVGEKWEFV